MCATGDNVALAAADACRCTGHARGTKYPILHLSRSFPHLPPFLYFFIRFTVGYLLLRLPSPFFPHSRFVPESFINSFAFYSEDVCIDYFLFLYDGKEEYIWRIIEIEFQEI